MLKNCVKIEQSLYNYIKLSFLPFSGLMEFNRADSFLENGIIDSTGILELIEYIENEFEIDVEDDEIVPQNFDCLDCLVRYVSRKLDHASS